MTPTHEAAMRQALEALEQLDGLDTETECVTIDVGDAIEALRSALAQQGEPVAELIRGEGGSFRVAPNMDALKAIYALPAGTHKLYAEAAPAPQARQGEQSGAVVHQHGFAKENQRLRTINESLDKQLDDVMRECDRRDEIINDLCDAVLGTDRHEWSSMYFFEDAVREVEERMEALAQTGEK